MKCQFEEKQFEQYLNYALAKRRNWFYSPGQVMEFTLGFDSAVYVENPMFWENFYPKRTSFPVGVKIDMKWWRKLDNSLNHFPQFKVNTFIQHKRPEYMTSTRGEAGKYWKQAYFRYRLTKHQQKALEFLEKQIKNKGVVAYASPAFYTLTELWHSLQKGTIIQDTNFVQPSKLSRHATYTYISANSIGRAFSEPENIETFNFLETTQVLSQNADSDTTNRRFITQIGNVVNEVMLENQTFSRVYAEIIETMPNEISEIETAIGFARVNIFCFLTQTTWRVAL